MRLRPLREQVAVVMGASSGIGRETAIQLADQGAKVIVSARGADGLDSLVEAILGFGGEVHAVQADTTDPAAAEEVAQKAVERYGRLDTWVQVSSVSLYARFEDTRPDEFEQVVRTNLLGVVNGAKAALPHLRRAGRGAFICVSSVEAVRALPYQSAYAAAKHGVDGMLEALRVELRHEGVPVAITQILPSSVDTPLFEHARTRIGVRPKGFPPVYDARLVAKAIVHAAQHPTRRLVVGGGGRLMAMIEGMAPTLLDGYLALAGFRGQRTRIRKSPAAPDNLERPLDRGHSVAGDDTVKGRTWSLYTAWTLSRWSRPATVALALAGGALLAGAVSRSRSRSGGQLEGGYEPELGGERLGRRSRYRNPYGERGSPVSQTVTVTRMKSR